VEFQANDHTYNMGYYIANEINSKWGYFCEANFKPPKARKNFNLIMIERLEKMWRGFWDFARLNCYSERIDLVLGTRDSLLYHQSLHNHAYHNYRKLV
jgi:hypothetical protein